MGYARYSYVDWDEFWYERYHVEHICQFCQCVYDKCLFSQKICIYQLSRHSEVACSDHRYGACKRYCRGFDFLLYTCKLVIKICIIHFSVYCMYDDHPAPGIC